ncbi:MAG TPA: universal stress protein, partial [Gemmatimonadales bacterium]|nr:universal stress protein [Gemmatimonadales bacterium]
MGTYQAILVPLDGSEFGERAIPLATDLAKRNDARLELAMVHQPLQSFATAIEMPEVGAEYEAEAQRREQEYLDQTTHRLASSNTIRVSSRLLQGSVAEALESHAHLAGIDLVVMSTHGRGAMGRFWLGSVADRLIRRLHAPVLVVRPSWREDAPAAEIRRILVPLDGSPLAETIMDEAIRFGGNTAEYQLVSVVIPPVPLMDMVPMTGMPDTSALVPGLVKSAEDYLGRIADRVRKQCRFVSTHVVIANRVHEGLLEQANMLGADLI